MPEAETAELRSRATFKLWTRVSLRYCDQDPLGHVNNSGLPIFFEQARCNVIYPILRAHGGPHLEIVLARTIIDYLKELAFPGFVEIGTRIDRIGTKSLALKHGVFKEGENVCAGTGECVLVFFDTGLRTSVAPPAAVRDALARLSEN